MTLAMASLTESFLKSPRLEGLSPRSHYNLRWSLAGLSQALGDVPLTGARREDIEAWVADMTPTTRAQSLWAARALYGWALRERLVQHNPTVGIPTRASTQPRGYRCAPQGKPKPPPRPRRQRPRVARVELRDLYAAQGLSPRSADNYSRLVADLERWCSAEGLELDTIGPSDLARYVATKPPSFSTRKGLKAALRRYWQAKGRDDPPLAVIRLPQKPEMRCRAPEEDDARILDKAARARGDLHGFAVLLGTYQGLRCAEMASLRWSSFGDDGWMTVVGKGEKERRIPIHPVVADAIAALPRPSSFIFPGRFGGPCSPSTIWQWTREVAADAGVERVSPHILRHLCLATMNDNTGDLRTVQAFAGHSRPETTSGYTRATGRRLQAAILAVRYDVEEAR